jgi:hypothetical protein
MQSTSSLRPFPKLPKNIWLITMTVFAVVMALFIPIHYWEPFSKILNDSILNFTYTFTALTAAIYGTLLVQQFSPGELPRQVWMTFVLGWWCAVLAEVLGIIYSFLMPEFPPFTLIDVAWLSAYFWLGLSLYYQHRLIFGKQKPSSTYWFVILLIVIVSAALTTLAQKGGLGEGMSWLVLFLAVLYPISDIFLGIYALRISLLFGRGVLGRPWWGLIPFAIADAISIYFWMGGDRLMAEQTLHYLHLFSDTCYIAGYMLTALGLLSVLMLSQKPEAESAPSPS